MNDRDGNPINVTATVVKPPVPVLGEVVLIGSGDHAFVSWQGDLHLVAENADELVVVENPVAVLTEVEWEISE